VCRAVREQTRPDDVILVVGCDWCSEIPYYSQRRALMVPVWHYTPVEDLPYYLERLRDYRLGALVVNHQAINDTRLAGALRDLRAWGLVAERSFEDEVYAVYTLRPAASSDGQLD
jgi:hypothetical protein